MGPQKAILERDVAKNSTESQVGAGSCQALRASSPVALMGHLPFRAFVSGPLAVL